MKNLGPILFPVLACLLLGGSWACRDIEDDSLKRETWVAVTEGNYVGYINTFGRRQIRTEFAAGRDFSEELAGVNVGAEVKQRGLPLRGKWGFIDQQGNFIINPVYQALPNGLMPYNYREYASLLHDGYRFSEGLAAVKLEGTWQYITRTGDVEISKAWTTSPGSMEREGIEIESARAFHGGFAAVKLKSGWGFINSRGRLVIPARYAYAYDTRGQYLMTLDRHGRIHCFTPEGLEVFRQRRLATPFSGGMAAAWPGFRDAAGEAQSRLLELMDENGRYTTRPQFDYAGACAEGLCPVRVGSVWQGSLEGASHLAAYSFEGGMWGYIDTTGTFRINPIFNEARGFSEGFAPVRLGKRWGYIDRNGTYLFKPQFSFAGPFHGGFARVRIGRNQEVHPQRSAWINRYGDIIWTDGVPN